MRTTTLSLITAACFCIAAPVQAGKGKADKPGQGDKGDKGKGDKGKGDKGKGDKGKGDKGKDKGGDSGKGGGSSSSKSTLVGSGQRQHFSFGGDIKVNGTKAWGHFTINAHPTAPGGSTLAVWCHYVQFSEAVIQGNSARFDGHGKCTTLSTSGAYSKSEVHSRFSIIDHRTGGDAISVDLVGPTGITISAGRLSSGDFTVTAGS